MRLLSWIRKLVGSEHMPATRRGRKTGRPSPPRWRPRVEALEERLALSTIPVTSPLDDVSQHGTLRYAVAHAGDCDTILLTPAIGNAGITLTQGELLLTQQHLTIRSASRPHPVTISGGNLSRVFEVASGASVALSDVTITGGNGQTGNPDDPHEGRGGGIVVDEGAALSIADSTVTGNTADRGGGIDDFGTLTVSCSLVSANQALSGYGGGIAVFSGAPFSPTFSATLAMTDSTVSGNTALQNGGGITGISSTVTVDHCVVTGNTATELNGGGLNNHLGIMKVRHSRVDDNTAPNGYGGGMLNSSGDTTTPIPGTLVVIDCDVDGNSAQTGGGIANAGDLTIRGSRLVKNSTSSKYDLGGGLFNDSGATARLERDILSDNFAGQGGGVFSFGAIVMRGCLLSDNSSFNSGGAIESFGSLDVKRSVFDHNSSYEGGAILSFGVTTISKSKIDNNFTTTDYGLGGGIATEGGSLTIDHSEIDNNTSTAGGGIYIDYGTVAISRSDISGNISSEDGGGIVNGGTLSLDRCTVSDNTAGGASGGIVNGSLLTVDHSTFSGNSATSDGGGITNWYSLTVGDSTFLANTPQNVFNYGGTEFIDNGGNTGL